MGVGSTVQTQLMGLIQGILVEVLLVSLGESGLSLELTFRVSPGMTQLQGKHIVILLPDVRKNVVPSQTLVISSSRSYLLVQG